MRLLVESSKLKLELSWSTKRTTDIQRSGAQPFASPTCGVAPRLTEPIPDLNTYPQNLPLAHADFPQGQKKHSKQLRPRSLRKRVGRMLVHCSRPGRADPTHNASYPSYLRQPPLELDAQPQRSELYGSNSGWELPAENIEPLQESAPTTWPNQQHVAIPTTHQIWVQGLFFTNSNIMPTARHEQPTMTSNVAEWSQVTSRSVNSLSSSPTSFSAPPSPITPAEEGAVSEGYGLCAESHNNMVSTTSPPSPLSPLIDTEESSGVTSVENQGVSSHARRLDSTEEEPDENISVAPFRPSEFVDAPSSPPRELGIPFAPLYSQAQTMPSSFHHSFPLDAVPSPSFTNPESDVSMDSSFQGALTENTGVWGVEYGFVMDTTAVRYLPGTETKPGDSEGLAKPANHSNADHHLELRYPSANPPYPAQMHREDENDNISRSPPPYSLSPVEGEVMRDFGPRDPIQEKAFRGKDDHVNEGPSEDDATTLHVPQFPPVPCRKCTKIFTGKYAKGNCKRHFRHVHQSITDTAKNVCRICRQAYKRADARRKHEWKKHRLSDAKPEKRRN